MDAWLLDPDKERDIVATAAVSCELAESEEMHTQWLDLGGEGCQGH